MTAMSHVQPLTTRQFIAAENQLALRRAMLMANQPKLRIRDAAHELGVSEMQLVALDCGLGVTRLTGDFARLIERLPALGRVMSLTRNESAVHERRGRFDNVRIDGPMGLVLNKEIDLRLFMRQYVHAFAVETPRGESTLRSIQFFDATGMAVNKVYLTDQSDEAAYATLVREYTSPDQSADAAVEAPPERPALTPDARIDVKSLRSGWDQLRDVHDFFGLLRAHKVARTQAFRLVGEMYCRRVANDALWTVLNAVAGRAFPIMVFVGNRGCIQIHSGPVSKIARMGPWANVLDADFNLHVREDRIAESWVVMKPTDEGIVTSLETFDTDGETIAQMFSLREPGQREVSEWPVLLRTLASV